MLTAIKSGIVMRRSPLEKRAAKSKMSVWLLLLGVLILILWGSFALIEEQPANPANDRVSSQRAARELRIALTSGKENQVEDHEATVKNIEPESEPAPEYTCYKKFQDCPTRD